MKRNNMNPNQSIIAYGLYIIFVLAFTFPPHAWGQGSEQTDPKASLWRNALKENRFPVAKLDFFTKLKWFGLGIVAPQKLDSIVGFFAYPARDVCDNAKYFSQDSVLVVEKPREKEAWTLDDYSALARRFETAVESKDHIGSGGDFLSLTIGGPQKWPSASGAQYPSTNSSPAVDEPLTYFCEQYQKMLSTKLEDGQVNIYLGFSDELSEPVAKYFKNAEVFWSTTNAVGLKTTIGDSKQ